MKTLTTQTFLLSFVSCLFPFLCECILRISAQPIACSPAVSKRHCWNLVVDCMKLPGLSSMGAAGV